MKFNGLRDLYQNVNQRTGGSLDILRQAFRSFKEQRASRSAAGMTYYTLFSLFPLLIVIVTVTSFFLDNEKAIDAINQVITTAIPVSGDLLQRNIERVVDLRGSVGVVGLVGLLWSASNAFSMLVDNINQAFLETEKESIIRERLFAFGILGTILVLLILLTLVSTTNDILKQLQLPFLESSFLNSEIWGIAHAIYPWVVTFFLFVSLFRWVPDTGIHWKAAVWSGAVVTVLWDTTSIGFRWYLSSGLANYELVYGSLSAIVILLFWIYISSMILFFGAHLCSAINQSME